MPYKDRSKRPCLFVGFIDTFNMKRYYELKWITILNPVLEEKRQHELRAKKTKKNN